MNSSPSRLPEEVLSELAKSRCPVRFRSDGVSMHPYIRKGDTVTIVPPEGEGGGIIIGDVVLIAGKAGRCSLHRVIAREGADAVVTKGDALLHADPPASPGEIRGRVISVERRGSRREYGLGGPSSRRFHFCIALLSRMEASVVGALFPSSRKSGNGPFLSALLRAVKFPKWLLIRIFSP